MLKLRLSLYHVLAGALLMGAAGTTASVSDRMSPSADHRKATPVITQVMERWHYRNERVDDRMSAAILERYLEMLDPNRSILTAADVASFQSYRTELDDVLRSGQLEPAFEIFTLFRERLQQRVA